MPYFITDKSADCSGWATIKEDGEVLGCHTTKQAAIDQMVAISIAEEIEPGGERAEPNDLLVGDFVSWNSSGGRARGQIERIVRDGSINVPNSSFTITGTPDDPAALIVVFRETSDGYENTDVKVAHKFSTLTKIDDLRSKRLESGPQAVIVDIDGTLIDADGRVEKVYNFLDDMEDTAIFIVTGRNVDRREETIKQLDELSIDYNRLFMNPGSTADTADFKRVTAENLLKEYNVILAIDNNPTMRKVYRDLGITALDVPDVPDVPSDEDNPDEERQVNLTPPSYMRAAARRGLELNRQGFGGDGLTDKTKQEARDMADGRVSEDKWRRIAPWIARHLVDLDAPKNSNPADPEYPGAGLVAHLLWGSGPSKRSAQRTLDYAQGVINRLDAEENKARYSSINVNLNKEEKETQVNKVERRVKTDVDFELRVEAAESDGMRFTGYAAVFNSDSEPLPFIERIMPGAFKRSLKARNEVKLFKNHNMDEVLASTRSKTLRLSEDSKGLLAEATLPDTTAGRDLAVLMKRGDVHAMSFGFSVPARGDSWSDDGMTRQLKEIRLHEVSIVTGFPAYEATTASVRSLDILATRTNVNVDALADAMVKLEAGEKLAGSDADLLQEVVSKLRDNTPSPDELLEIKRKQLDLLFKAI
jgi:HK97 family phage prohead protease